MAVQRLSLRGNGRLGQFVEQRLGLFEVGGIEPFCKPAEDRGEQGGRLLWFLPPSLVSPAAILATGAEVILAVGLLVGWRLHWWAFAAAALLLSFALAMTGALGVKAPTDASVWTATAAAFLLGVVTLREHGAEGTRNFDADARKQERDARARVTQKVDH